MTIDITNPALINRQYAMRDCGVSAQQVNTLMTMTDDALVAGIAKLRAAMTVLTGANADRCAQGLRASEIEADLRGLAV